MQAAKNLTQNALSEIASRRGSPTQTTTTGWKGSSLTKTQLQELVNRAFTRLEAIYPRTWRTSFTTDQMVQLAKREVAISMAKWSILPTAKSLDAALERIKAEGNEWPPSVARLIAMLKPQPEDFGMPSEEVAFDEAIQYARSPSDHRWSHAAVREAGKATGWFDLASASSESRIRKLKSGFVKQYRAVVNRVMSGGPVEARGLLGSDGQLTPSQLAERKGREEAAARAHDEFGSAMTADQGLAMIRGLLSGGASS